MKKNYLLLLPIFLSSCFYQVTYFASYDIRNKGTYNKSKAVSVNLINNLADKYNLRKEEKNYGTDTLGFTGDPYHWFKFIIIQKDSINSTIRLEYGGAFGSRRKPPYKNMLYSLTDSIRTNFVIVKQDIREYSNERRK